MIDQSLIEQAYNQGIQKFAVGAIVIRDKTILLLKRKSTDSLPGIFELPGGGVEQNESIEQALSRELLEETGLSLKQITKYADFFDYQNQARLKTRIFNFVITVENFSVTQTPEHDSYVWAKFEDISKYNITSETLKVISAICAN